MRRAFLRGSCAAALGLVTGSVADSQELVYTALTPCRVIDTRIPAPQALAPGVTRTFLFRGPTTNYSLQGGTAAGCGIPGLTNDGGQEQNAATAVAVNLIAVGPTGAGHITAWPANQAPPQASVVNFSASAATGGLNVANGIILPLCNEVAGEPCVTGDISFAAGVSSTHLVADVVGYLASAGRPNTRRYGALVGADRGLCNSPVAGIRFGLSDTLSTFQGTASACPPGNWVCSEAERGTAVCDTTRFNSDCDYVSCAGDIGCSDLSAEQHIGWTGDAAPLTGGGRAVSEQGSAGPARACNFFAVWCCSR